jgi:hypothetical protein
VSADVGHAGCPPGWEGALYHGGWIGVQASLANRRRAAKTGQNRPGGGAREA